MHLNHHPEASPCTPSPWKSCLPWNQSLVPKRLGAVVLQNRSDVLFFFFLHFNSLSRNTTHLVSRGLRKKEEVVGRFIWVRLTRIFTAPNFEEIFVFLKSLFCFPCRQALESKSIALQLLQRQTFLMRSPWIQVYHEEALEWARRTPCVR